MMADKLQNAPDEQFDIDDDADAKVLLLELGILDKFTTKLPSHETTQAVVYREHPTHHILALLYAGHSNPVDNGFFVFCLPRSRFSPEQFQLFADRFLAPTSTNVLGFQAFGGPPTNN